MANVVGTLAKIFIGFVMVAFLVGVTGYIISFQQAFSLKTYVSDQISREGGLTTQAMSNIDSHVVENYGSKFEVESTSGGGSKPYGEVTTFVVKGAISPNVFNLPATLVSTEGEATSRIR